MTIACQTGEVLLGHTYRIEPTPATLHAMETGLWSPDDLPHVSEYISGAEFTAAGTLTLNVTQGQYWTGNMEVHWTILCAAAHPG